MIRLSALQNQSSTIDTKMGNNQSNIQMIIILREHIVNRMSTVALFQKVATQLPEPNFILYFILSRHLKGGNSTYTDTETSDKDNHIRITALERSVIQNNWGP